MGILGYSLRGRRGLSVRVGNTTIRRLILEERKQFRHICVKKHVINFTNVVLLCVAKSLGGVGN